MGCVVLSLRGDASAWCPFVWEKEVKGKSWIGQEKSGETSGYWEARGGGRRLGSRESGTQKNQTGAAPDRW